MRIIVLSDLHFEFEQDGGEEFVASLEPVGADVPVLAGDIGVGSSLDSGLDRLCRRFSRCPVVFVLGNHEFYRVTQEQLLTSIELAQDRNPNLIWLHNSAAVVAGARFVGSTMWFPFDGLNRFHSHKLVDFTAIPNFDPWVYEENARSLSFLDREVGEDSVVVTHHLPSPPSIARDFAGSEINRFFMCDRTDLIRRRRPVLWVHGHTHRSCDYHLGATRIVCNPRGYFPGENPAFDPRKTVQFRPEPIE